MHYSLVECDEFNRGIITGTVCGTHEDMKTSCRKGISGRKIQKMKEEREERETERDREREREREGEGEKGMEDIEADKRRE